MTIQEVVSTLRKEKQDKVPSRFPCRAIMLKNVEQYCQLLFELKNLGDTKVVQSSELFTSYDVMPSYDKLKNPTYHNEWLILTGVSEYLRLFSKKEAADRRFASLWSYQAPASSTGRIIIPLWGCEAQWFDSAINLNGDLRQQDFYYDCTDSSTEEPEMNLLVLSGMFEQHLSKLEALQGNLSVGLQDWFEYWENPSSSNNHFVLLTKRFNSITTTSGKISIHVVNDTFSFIRENMPGAGILEKDTCSEEMTNILFDYALKGYSLKNAILASLNVTAFYGIDIMGKWNVLTKGHKELVALWLKLYPDDTYLCHCFVIAKEIDVILDCIAHDIFNVRLDRQDWIKEYQELSKVLAIKPDDKFFEHLDAVPDYEDRLEFLTNGTRDERIYLLRMVGSWMRKDSAQVKLCEKLEMVYPELFAYLCNDVSEMSQDISDYMSLYKSYKLENALPDDEDTYFNGIKTDSHEYRYAVLSDYADDDTLILWIDAMGIEWLPLLTWALEKNCDAILQRASITLANLPTETRFNEQWNDMPIPYLKLDKLDKLAHKGVVDEPDYYSCIEEQLAFVSSITKHVNSALEQHHRVIITGDHGTSRLAARFFHKRDGISAPMDAKVYSHGRYCSLAGSGLTSIPNTVFSKHSDGTLYLIFENYDHFKQPGFAAGADDDNAIYGEVHGGATPEELLVPVVVLDSKKEKPLKASWDKETVKIATKKARLTLNFNRAVSQIEVIASGINASTQKVGDGTIWNATIAGIKPGPYDVTVVADGHILPLPAITIIPALSDGEGDLP